MESQGAPESHQGAVQHVRKDPATHSDACKAKSHHSMPRRLEEVIVRQGASTKY